MKGLIRFLCVRILCVRVLCDMVILVLCRVVCMEMLKVEVRFIVCGGKDCGFCDLSYVF